VYGQWRKCNVVSNGTYRTESGDVSEFLCRNCGKTFFERSITALFDLRAEEKKMLMASKMFLRGMNLRGTVEILEMHLNI
jgi:transposase-like protein